MNLTPRMRETLIALRDHINSTGTSPTYRQLAEKLGCASPSAALRLIDDLVARGYVRRHRGKKGYERRGNSNNLVLVFGLDAEPNWEGIAYLLLDECKTMRQTLNDKNLPVPPKSIDY